MAWTTPETAVAGQVLTAAWLNQNVRDNTSFLYTPPIVVVRRDANQSVANNTIVEISFDSEDVDTDQCFTATSTNITIKTAGIYLLQGTGFFTANGAGAREVGLRKNGTVISNTTTGGGGGPMVGGMLGFSAFGNGLSAGGITRLAVNDVITFYLYQNSGTALNCTARCQVLWVGQD